jgi:CP family cyanate transporter-like MFS transporter
MSQGFGYLIAGLGPLGVGALHGVTGSWTLPLAVLGAILVLQLLAGIVASRPVHIRARGAQVSEAA